MTVKILADIIKSDNKIAAFCDIIPLAQGEEQLVIPQFNRSHGDQSFNDIWAPIGGSYYAVLWNIRTTR